MVNDQGNASSMWHGYGKRRLIMDTGVRLSILNLLCIMTAACTIFDSWFTFQCRIVELKANLKPDSDCFSLHMIVIWLYTLQTSLTLLCMFLRYKLWCFFFPNEQDCFSLHMILIWLYILQTSLTLLCMFLKYKLHF